MTVPIRAAAPSTIAAPGHYVVTAQEVVPLGVHPGTGLGAGMDCLVDQEVRGRRREKVPPRQRRLLQEFGFEWESLSEPGHMRFVSHAAFMLRRAAEMSRRTAESILAGIQVPVIHLDGVSLIDPSVPTVRGYLTMTSGGAALYGDSPYEVGGAGRPLMLRQTSCFQKFSVCLGGRLAAGSLPTALFEISDSFRREPEDALQLGFRVRRFHLPEAHVHTRDVAESVEISQALHPRILRVLSELEADLVLLINATYDFAREHADYFRSLASRANAPALLIVCPPGRMCQDGVEVDVEYKVVDATGCCRELSTFQIDTEITRTFGVRCDDGTIPSTIHAVFSGGVERHLYLMLDRIVRAEARGERRGLPLWLSPVVVRVVPADARALPPALAVAGRLAEAGIRTDLDDRGHDVESAIGDADALLVPYTVLVSADRSGDARTIQVREFVSGQLSEWDTDGFIAALRRADLDQGGAFRRLSRQGLNTARET